MMIVIHFKFRYFRNNEASKAAHRNDTHRHAMRARWVLFGC